MTDDDIDARLRDHGTTWREAHHDRPGIDWDVVTKPRSTRTLFAVVGVSVAAAAIVVPLVVTAGHHNASPPAHRPHPSPTSTNIRQPHGVGIDFYGLTKHRVNVVLLATPGRNQTWFSISEGGGRPRALGVAPIDTGAYAAFALPHCTTSIQRFTFNGIDGGDTVPGGQPATPVDGGGMAVSPNGKKLALIVDAPTPPTDLVYTNACNGPQRIAVLNLETHRVREWAAPRYDAVRSLAWSPDSRHIAFEVANGCEFEPANTSLCLFSGGTHVLDTTPPGHDLASAPVVLPMLPRRGVQGAVGPVFWWHGQLVTSFGGSLRLLNGRGGLGKAVATGLPKEVDSISSDPTGDHLLISSQGTTYRWDNGKLSVIKGVWTQPGW
jgi:hypothetical protein